MFEPLEKFKSWFHCICIVTFDIEIGQAIEAIYPTDINLDENILTEDDKTNICYLAFPDSNSSCLGDTSFFIRIKRSKPYQLTQFHKWYNNQSSAGLEASTEYFYGFVYFRQEKDKNLPRGYFQKSIVLLSPLPYISLFSDICCIIAKNVFSDFNLLNKACSDIDKWPQPRPICKFNDTLTLPLLNTSIRVEVPTESKNYITHYILNEPNTADSILQCSDFEMNSFQSCSSLMSHVQLLWELVLTCEPIFVMTNSPASSSHIVYFLTSIIHPLIYCAVHRPYFTIHDNDFKKYTIKNTSLPPAILGATNPFFFKTLQNWPNIIFIDPSNKQTKLKKYNSNKVLESTPGLYTQQKSFVTKDKSVFKKILKVQRPMQAQVALFKKYMLELTESFLHPLERFIQKSMPLEKDINPFRSLPQPPLFDQDEFISSISSDSKMLPHLKGDWVGLYKKFFQSPNFFGWYSQKLKGIQQKIAKVYLEKLAEEDFNKWVKNKREVELIDMILNIQSKIKDYSGGVMKESLQKKLKHCMSVILNSLPADTQSCVTIKEDV